MSTFKRLSKLKPVHALQMSRFEQLPQKLKERILDWTIGRQPWPFFFVGPQHIAINSRTGIEETVISSLSSTICPMTYCPFQRYINDDQFSGIRKVALLNKSFKEAVRVWHKRYRDSKSTLAEESFKVHFKHVAEMHAFITGLSQHARSLITDITGSWNTDIGSSLPDSAVHKAFEVIANDCTSLHTLTVRVDLRSIDLYHLNGVALRKPGQHRRGWSADALAGFKALGALKRTIEARGGSYVKVFERRSRDAELQTLMAEG